MKKDEKDEQRPRVRPNIRPDTQEYKLWLFLISCSGSGMKQALVWNKLWYETRSGMKQAHEQRSSASSKLSPTWLIPNSLPREKSKMENLKFESCLGPEAVHQQIVGGPQGSIMQKASQALNDRRSNEAEIVRRISLSTGYIEISTSSFCWFVFGSQRVQTVCC